MAAKDNSQEKDSSYIKKITAYPWQTTLDQIDALARQRQREQPPDLQRLAMYIGALFISIQSERGPDGKYGLWSDTTIQEQIRSWVAIGNDWLTDQGRPLYGREGGSSPLTAALEHLLRGGLSFGSLRSELTDRVNDGGNVFPSNGKPGGDPLAGTKDFVLDATVGADLNLDENEIW